jgi:hypothetical protein
MVKRWYWPPRTDAVPCRWWPSDEQDAGGNSSSDGFPGGEVRDDRTAEIEDQVRERSLLQAQST